MSCIWFSRHLLLLAALVFALPLAVATLITVPSLAPSVIAQDDEDDDEDEDDDNDGGEIDEDDNRGHGNDEDGVDEDNPGNGKDKDKDDEEDDFITAVPTETLEATRAALTPVNSPTSTSQTTGNLVIRLRNCPAGTDPAQGAATLRDACPAGEPDAEFTLSGRSGLYAGWSREVTTGPDGDVEVDELAAGTYSLTLDDGDWCAAEASSVNDGLIVIDPGQTTTVTAYLCDDSSTPTGGS